MSLTQKINILEQENHLLKEGSAEEKQEFDTQKIGELQRMAKEEDMLREQNANLESTKQDLETKLIALTGM
jgi:hypothetical protein